MSGKINYSAIKLDRGSSVPLYSQLAEELRRQIADIPLNSREKLLSERKVAELLDLDRSTVNKAFAELKKQSLITAVSARILQLFPEGRRRNLSPFPNIGVVIPDNFSFRDASGEEQIPLEYIKGIMDCASENRFSVIMLRLPDTNMPAAEINRFINDTGSKVTGIIHLGDRMLYPDSPLQKLMRFKELPQVIISADTGSANIMQVLPDIRPGAEQLAERLRELNLKKIGIVSATAGFDGKDMTLPYFRYTSFRRPAEFRKIFQDMGLDCDEKCHLFSCANYPATLKNLLLKMESGNLPQVYCCHNDISAGWLLHACSELGLRVPEDLSITGFDGLDIPENGNPATIRLPFYEIGRKAVEVLLECHRSGKSQIPGIFTVPTTFIDGKTLGKNIKPR